MSKSLQHFRDSRSWNDPSQVLATMILKQGYVAVSDPGVLEGWNFSMFFWIATLTALCGHVCFYRQMHKRKKKSVIYAIRRFFMISAIVIAMWMLENWKMKKAVFFNSSYLHWNTEEQGAESVVCKQQTSMTIWTEKNHTSTFLSMSWSVSCVYNMNHLSASPFFAAARAEFCF